VAWIVVMDQRGSLVVSHAYVEVSIVPE
jgi:hypothetical protein